MKELQIKISQEPAVIRCNFDDVKAQLSGGVPGRGIHGGVQERRQGGACVSPEDQRRGGEAPERGQGAVPGTVQ